MHDDFYADVCIAHRLEAVWLKNVRCKALEIVVFFRYSSLNSATIRLEAAKKSNRFKNFSLGHFLTNQLLIFY
ncbi:MAG: hypothetical protein V3V18_15820 [Methylococcales bacterium]